MNEITDQEIRDYIEEHFILCIQDQIFPLHKRLEDALNLVMQLQLRGGFIAPEVKVTKWRN